MDISNVTPWISLVGNLIVQGVLTVAQVKGALTPAGPTDLDTKDADDAVLAALKDYIATKFGDAVALSHFGE